MYQISVTALPVKVPGVHRWCLDFPKAGPTYEESELLEKGLNFQGWVLPEEDCLVKAYLRLGEQTHYFALDVARADVVERVLKASADKNPNLLCGFTETVPFDVACGYFGLEVDGARVDTARVEIFGSLRIIEGREGWLYLDNDSNRSVEQFRGEFLLDRAALRGWQEYLDGLSSLSTELGIRHALLIAPAKEMVLPEFYPFKKGQSSPVEQVLGLACPEHHMVYPVVDMRGCPSRPFRLCDTHWTPMGALYGLLAALGELGLDPARVKELFEGDQYKESEHSGDLGSKVYPRRTATEKVLTGVHYRKWVAYDNFLPNMGRVLITRKDDALIDGKCLIFGSSSSYSMFNYVCRVFSEVIFVHSAGSLDMDVVRSEAPDYLLLQTNGRFVVRPPELSYSLADDVVEKWARLDSSGRSEVLKKYSRWEEPQNTFGHYHGLLPLLQ